MQTLTSARNPLLKEVRKAVLRGTPTGAGFCVAESLHLLDEALRSESEIQAVIVSETARAAVEGRSLQQRVLVLPEELFQTLAATEASQGVITLVRAPQWALHDILVPGCLAVVLDGIQDPGNAGAVIRSAEAFGATGVVFLKGTVSPFNPKAIRASAGSLFRVPVIAGVESEAAADALKRIKIKMYALMPKGDLALSACDLSKDCALIAGSEGHGVSEPLARFAEPVRIPTAAVESLNVALAAGIALYEARRQRGGGT
jgi:TrmH family RNA methyltransferase